MLFVHFTPVKNVKSIMKKGITLNNGKIYLFPMIKGRKTLINTWSGDQWWDSNKEGIKAQSRMAKIIIKLPPNEKVRFGDWINAFCQPLISVRELGSIINREIEEIEKGIQKKEFYELTKKIADEDPEEYSQALSLDYWFGGNEVIYEKPIPREWIVNVFIYPRNDFRIKQYRRCKRKFRHFEIE